MLLASQNVLPASPETAARLRARTVEAPAPTGEGAMRLAPPTDTVSVVPVVRTADLLVAPLEMYAVGRTACGFGSAGAAVRGVAAVGACLSLARATKHLASEVTPAQVQDELRGANGGRDLAPAVAQNLAHRRNVRDHVVGLLGVLNATTSGAALATCNLGWGLAAIALKMGQRLYEVYALETNAREAGEALAHTARVQRGQT